MSNLIDQIKQILYLRRSSSDNGHDHPHAQSAGLADEETISLLMELIEQTREGEYSCEETFDLLDEYVELALGNQEEAVTLMPLVKNHIDGCPDCHDRYEALLQILQTT